MKIKVVKKCEKIDYKRIEELTRKVVREELSAISCNEEKNNVEESLKNVIAQGIIEAEKLKAEAEKERIKNTKLSAFSICAMVFFSLVAAFFALLSIAAFFNSSIINGCKMAFVSITYVFIVFLEYAVGKNKDKNFTFNVISILLAFIPIVFSVIS